MPAFPSQSGPCIVLGAATSALDDLAAARSLYPAAPVMAVNRAAKLAPGDFVTGLWIEEVGRAYESQRALFGTNPTRHVPYPPLGARVDHFRRTGEPIPEEKGAWDHAWPGAQCGATSAWCAVRIAKAMGFLPVILAGVPLDASGYAAGAEHDIHPESWTAEDHRLFGYRERLAEYLANGEGEGVYSMSGYTAERLGNPPAN